MFPVQHGCGFPITKGSSRFACLVADSIPGLDVRAFAYFLCRDFIDHLGFTGWADSAVA